MYWPPDGAPNYTHDRLELVPGDLRDRDSLRRALKGVDIVYNIAALYRPTNVPDQMFWDVNVDGVRNLVELAVESGVKRFVHCSTIGVHGHVHDPPANEDAPIKPDDHYQFTKLKGEEAVRNIGRQRGLEVAIIRPAAIYGPLEQRFLKLPKLIRRKRFVMFGRGDVLYHFIHIQDLCEAFVLCAKRDEAVGRTYIIADDHAITLNTIVTIIAEALEMTPPKRHLPLFTLMWPSIACELACKPFKLSPPLHRRRASWFFATRSFDISRARGELGFDPKVSPDQGLRDMVKSYQSAGWL